MIIATSKESFVKQ